MIEQAIIYKTTITRTGQRVGFQVRLPKDAKRLIGLEYDIRKIDAVLNSGEQMLFLIIDEPQPLDDIFKRNTNQLIGRLSLQNTFCEGLFYQGDLIEDRNEKQYEEIAAHGFAPKPWTHSTRREEMSISVNPGLIQGLYEDCHNLQDYEELEYELILYFWIEKCANDN